MELKISAMHEKPSDLENCKRFSNLIFIPENPSDPKQELVQFPTIINHNNYQSQISILI